MEKRALLLALTLTLSIGITIVPGAQANSSFSFSTGSPDGKIATASRPSGVSIEVETADDFILTSATTIDHATFVGLLPTTEPLTSAVQVRIEIYRVFPKDSVDPPSGNVPTRVNSPSDNAFDQRDSTVVGDLTYTATLLSPSFTAANSVVNGIHPIPNQFTGGEGPVTGEEVQFNVTLTKPFTLPADHYFFVPQVSLSDGNFLSLSAPKPITGGTGPFTPDLQTWIRNADLDPDWLRIGTDITHGGPFNAVFSLSGTSSVIGVPEFPIPGVLASVIAL